ncbi:hypothetical protein ACTXK7_07150 [Vreelandella alkaliphila]|uniref:hypothetical protein n=1 Tax=Vreelandella alkaliphila TaxID=272774 RepID=UPI003FD85451
MFPIPPTAIIFGALFFLMRSNLGGVIMGGVLVLVALHLWPEAMAVPYEWVGTLVDSTGLRGLVEDTDRAVENQ